jgi:hypothetical protein
LLFFFTPLSGGLGLTKDITAQAVLRERNPIMRARHTRIFKFVYKESPEEGVTGFTKSMVAGMMLQRDPSFQARQARVTPLIDNESRSAGDVDNRQATLAQPYIVCYTVVLAGRTAMSSLGAGQAA